MYECKPLARGYGSFGGDGGGGSEDRFRPEQVIDRLTERITDRLRDELRVELAKEQAEITKSAAATGRGLHSSTFQLNLSRVRHKNTPYTPYTPLTRATQPLTYIPNSIRSAQVELNSGRV